jgi:two-component system, cell cycle sensor histidine kinase and response regulator CckA
MASVSGRGASHDGKCEQLQAELEELRIRLVQSEDARLSAEKALRDTKTRLEAFLDNSPVVAFLKDEHGRYVYVNQPYLRTFQRDFASVVDATDFEIFPAEVARQLRANDALVLETNRPVETIEIAPTPDGVSHAWLAYKFVVQESSGRRFLGGMALDITKHQQTEQTLRQQQCLLQNIIQHIPCAVFWKDTDGVYLGGNTRSAHDVGVNSPDELIGKTDLDFVFSREEAEFYRRCDREVMTTGRPLLDIEETQHRADGGKAFLLTSKVPLRDGNEVIGVLGVYADITERKRAEDEIATREQLMRAIIEAAGAVPYTRNYAAGCFDYVGPGIKNLLGCAADEFTVERWDSLALEFFLPNQTKGLTPAEARKVFRQEPSTSWYADIRVRTMAGEDRWLFNAAVKILDSRGEVACSWGMLQDITQRKHLEERVRQSHKMEAIGQLAGGVAHDFNNLLCVINGYGQLLLNDMRADDPSAVPVREIVRAGERAAGLTRQLLAFGRKAILEPKVLDLKEVVSDLQRMLSRIIGEDVELATQIDSAPALIKADPGHIEQIIMNLVVNARDAMPQGGKLTLEVRAADLNSAHAAAHPETRPGPHVLLAVKDTGKGMDKATMARIWEPFFSTKGEKGCGLGLATVYGAVRQNGGHIDVSSELGRGTTFTVYLPRAPERRRGGPTPLDAAQLPRGDETILLVEDEAAVRDLARQILQGCGYEVLAAANGPDALLVAQTHSGALDLLVTDVVMPQMGGREVADRLTRMRPGLRVLYMSGYTDDSIMRHGILEHEVAFLSKPFSAVALAEKVRGVLDQHSQRAAHAVSG